MSDVLQSVLKTKLQTVLDNYLTGSTCATNVLNLALSVWSQNEANILVVDRVGNLPYLEYYTSPNSVLCFISDIGVFAISSNMRWITLDGRLLRNDQNLLGLAWSWGRNDSGQLGNNTNTSRSSPVSVVGGFIDWCDISTGTCHSVAVRSSGSTWSWGDGQDGRLGDNTNTIFPKSSPVSVVGGFTDWCQASANREITAAVRTNGTVWTWGRSFLGILGDNSSVARSSPVSVVGGFTDWCQSSAGKTHTAAVRTNGTAWTWGQNQHGQLGDNSTTSKSSPVSVVGGFTDWCQVSANGQTAQSNHNVAIRSSGSIWTWGRNHVGQLGDNTTENRSSPVSVVGGFSDWRQVSAGANHTVAVRLVSGSVRSAWAWGNNSNGELGNNAFTARSSPVSVVGGFSDWCQASGGGIHTVAVRTSGSAWAWGCNRYGRLGDNTTIVRSSPVSVVGGFSDWCKVSAGEYQSLGIRNIC